MDQVEFINITNILCWQKSNLPNQ